LKTLIERNRMGDASIPPAPADDDDACWYFAIGSMMLIESYQLRGLSPTASLPAELYGYRLGFFGPMGFAEAIPTPLGESSMHGVMHRVTQAQMKQLDKVEIGYVRRTGKARPYNNRIGSSSSHHNNELVTVTVYCRPDGANQEEENRPPKERYMEILIAGATQFGVDPTYIDFLKQHEYQPRTQPADFQSFARSTDDDNDNPKHYTQVPASNDDNLFFSLNGKVFQVTYPPDHPHRAFLRHLLGKYGPHLEVGMSQLVLDLKYGAVKDLKDCTSEHSAYIEDSHYRFMEQSGALGYYKVLGSFAILR